MTGCKEGAFQYTRQRLQFFEGPVSEAVQHHFAFTVFYQDRAGQRTSPESRRGEINLTSYGKNSKFTLQKNKPDGRYFLQPSLETEFTTFSLLAFFLQSSPFHKWYPHIPRCSYYDYLPLPSTSAFLQSLSVAIFTSNLTNLFPSFYMHHHNLVQTIIIPCLET